MKISVEIKDGKAYISTPYNGKFVHYMKQLGARWDTETKRWIVPEEMLRHARTAMKKAYGETDLTPASELVTLKVHTTKEVWAIQEAIIIAGRTVARAFDRDGGAIVGNGVAFIRGAPESGGSRTRWATVIPADAEFEIYDVPIVKAEEVLENPPEDCEVAIIDKRIDRDALIAERKQLWARLLEIHELLKETGGEKNG